MTAGRVSSGARRPDRRSFLAGGAASAVLAGDAAAQAPAARIGLLAAPADTNYGHHIAAIRKGLREAGFVEGRDFAFEFRWAGGQYDRLPGLAADLVRSRVDVIMTLGGGPPVRAARAATSTIPIVFHLGADPVRLGLVESMSRPGGNVTGVTLMTNDMEAKRLELLLRMVPAAGTIGILANPANQSAASQIAEIRRTAEQLRVGIVEFAASSERELEEDFAQAAAQRIDALTVLSDVFFTSNSGLLASLSNRHGIPAIAHSREFVEAGGLMSYGTNLAEAYRMAGIYAGRILKGEKAADLPVIEPTRFDLLINLRTAKALRLSVPPDLLVLAEEIVE